MVSFYGYPLAPDRFSKVFLILPRQPTLSLVQGFQPSDGDRFDEPSSLPLSRDCYVGLFVYGFVALGGFFRLIDPVGCLG